MRISDWSSDVCSSDLPLIGGVVLPDPGAGAGLHDHLMPGGGEFAHRERRQADPIFVILDFLGNTHTHHILSIARSRAVARRRPVRNAAFYPADDRRSKVPTPVRVWRMRDRKAVV